LRRMVDHGEIEKLRLHAARCRDMAEHAYDPKEATTLRETANHVEIAIAKLEGRPQQDA
jgi:hypothetical protein